MLWIICSSYLSLLWYTYPMCLFEVKGCGKSWVMKPSCGPQRHWMASLTTQAGETRRLGAKHNRKIEKIQTKRVICSQKKTESSAVRTRERGSCKQVAVLKQYSWISSWWALIIIIHCLPQWRGVPAPNSLRFPNNTNEAGFTNTISTSKLFYMNIWHCVSCYCPNRSGEMWIVFAFCARKESLALVRCYQKTWV